MWLCLQRRTLTAALLTGWGIEATKTCVLFHQHPESHEHLFAQHPVAKALWIRVCMWISRLTFNATYLGDFLLWSINHAIGKAQPPQLFKMVLLNVSFPCGLKETSNCLMKGIKQWILWPRIQHISASFEVQLYCKPIHSLQFQFFFFMPDPIQFPEFFFLDLSKVCWLC